MSYYETPQGAKVFAAGTMNFGGSATRGPQKKLLDNLWARLPCREPPEGALRRQRLGARHLEVAALLPGV